MPSVATRRLIDAAATLDPADRALLNLWVNRGLPDEQLTRLTRLSPDALAQRRERIVERLGETLGLPDEDVTAALAGLAAGVDEVAGAGRDEVAGAGPDEVAGAGSDEVDGAGPASEPAERRPARRRRPLPLLLAGLALLVAVVVVLAVALSSGGSGKATSRGAPRAAIAGVAPLTGLPGGPAGAGGEAQVGGHTGSLTLDLRVRSLPSLAIGSHYEAWLFNSVVDSVALGALPHPTGELRVRLPAHAGRYAWIDVSLQSGPGAGHSGVSVLRAPNPLQTR